MLSAGSRGSVGVYPDVVGPYVYVDIFFYVGHHVHGNEGCLPLALCVEGRDAPQPVHSLFRLQEAVCIESVHLELHRLDTRLISRQHIELLDLEAVPVGPFAVHTVEHRRPVAGLRTARSGVDVDDGVCIIILL